MQHYAGGRASGFEQKETKVKKQREEGGLWRRPSSNALHFFLSIVDSVPFHLGDSIFFFWNREGSGAGGSGREAVIRIFRRLIRLCGDKFGP